MPGSRSILRRLSLFAVAILLLGLCVPSGSALANHPALSCLDVEPETSFNPTLPAGTRSHTVEATLRGPATPPDNPATCKGDEMDAEGGAVKISFEISGPNDPAADGDTPDSPDRFCLIPQNAASCEMTYPGAATGSDTIRGWIDEDSQSPAQGGMTEADEKECLDEFSPTQECAPAPPSDPEGDVDGPEPDDTDVVQKTWRNVLDCEPETTTGAARTTHVITCTASDGDTTPTLIPGANVDVEITGANDPDPASPDFPAGRPAGDSQNTPNLTCTTGSDPNDAATFGKCSVSHGSTGAKAGGTTTYRAWIDADNSDATSEADQGEGRLESGSGSVAGEAEPDDTDIVDRTWRNMLECEPETDTGVVRTAQVITCTASDAQGTPTFIPGANVDIEITGANDPDPQSAGFPDGRPAGDSQNSPDLTCTTGSNPNDSATYGKCSVSHGPAGTDATGTSTYRAWIDSDDSDATSEADQAEGRLETGTGSVAGDKTEPDDTDVVSHTWFAHLDCGAETASNPFGSPHTVTCTALDSQTTPQPVPNIQVDAEATGANDPDGADSQTSPDFSCTTDAQGSCSFTHGPGGTGTTGTVGTTTYRAWVDVDGNHQAAPATHGVSEADTGEAQNENSTPGADPEPDDTDVVTKTWTGKASVDCDDESGDDTEVNPGEGGPASNETYTCTVRDDQGAVNDDEQVTVYGEVLNGVNDPDGAPEGPSYDSPDYSGPNASEASTCQTPDPDDPFAENLGVCQVTVTQADAELGTAIICFWVGEGDGETLCTAEQTNDPEADDNADKVEKTWQAREAKSVDLEPETDNNALSENHSITATIYDQFSDPYQGTTTVKFEFFEGSPTDTDGNAPATSDASCTAFNTTTCTFGYTQTASVGIDLICGWVGDAPSMAGSASDGTCDGEALVDADDDSTTADAPQPADDRRDVVRKVWDASRLDCSPETDDNPAGTAHSIDCNAKNKNDVNAPGARIDIEATGANDPDGANSPTTPDFTCTTDASGNCTVIHGTGGNGTTRGGGMTSYRAWIDIDRDDDSTEADTTEAQDHTVAGGGGAKTDPDDTDVVTKTWTQSAARLDCGPESETNLPGTSHEITCTARTSADAPVSNIGIDIEATGANDPGNGDSPEAPDFSCITDANGSCSFTHGPLGTTDSGTTTYRAWIDADDSDTSTEADQGEGRDEAVSAGVQEPDATDVVEKNWSTVSDIRMIPEETKNPLNQDQTVTVKVTDAQGNGISDLQVSWTETGEGIIVSSQSTTDDQGEADAIVRSSEPGNQRVTASVSPCADPEADCSGESVLHWGPSECTIFGTNGADRLRGTSGNDVICGFGGNDTLTGSGGNDRLLGGSGNDSLSAGAGRDTLVGGSGNDRLQGNRGNDILQGQGGRDTLAGGRANDKLYGGSGNDRLDGGTGRDLCVGGPGRDPARRCEIRRH